VQLLSSGPEPPGPPLPHGLPDGLPFGHATAQEAGQAFQGLPQAGQMRQAGGDTIFVPQAGPYARLRP